MFIVMQCILFLSAVLVTQMSPNWQ